MKKYWLLLLIVAQPLLDVLAYWTANDVGTFAGYIRLLILIAVLLYLLISKYKEKLLWVTFALCFIVFGGHILNSYRVGYVSFIRDINYVVRVSFMPVMALLFCIEINNKEIVDQIIKGIIINSIIISVVILVSYISNTYTFTYGEGLGISGWVTVDNRCAHSDILSCLCIFLVYFAAKNTTLIANIFIPIIVFVLLYTNGTRACYFTLVGLSVCFPLYFVFKYLFLRFRLTRNNTIFVLTMIVILIMSFIAYPCSPRAAEEEYKRSHFSTVEKEFVNKMNNMGYDIYNMSLEEKMNDPVVHDELRDYYNAFCWGGIPQIVERFDLDTIIYKYNGTIDSGTLGDTRVMKQKYASLIMDTQDTLTHYFGFEIAALGDDMIVDMENDWYAILYYYGYFGIAFYIIICLFIVFRIIKSLIKSFKEKVNDLNFTLLFSFFILLGLAYFSGAVLRRPNVSIYIALIIGMLYYETKYNYSGIQC